MSSIVHVKLTIEALKKSPEVRRFAISTDLSLSDFADLLRQEYDLQFENEPIISYTDNDGDVVVFSTEGEWKEALRICADSTLKLKVKEVANTPLSTATKSKSSSLLMFGSDPMNWISKLIAFLQMHKIDHPIVDAMLSFLMRSFKPAKQSSQLLIPSQCEGQCAGQASSGSTSITSSTTSSSTSLNASTSEFVKYSALEQELAGIPDIKLDATGIIEDMNQDAPLRLEPIQQQVKEEENIIIQEEIVGSSNSLVQQDQQQNHNDLEHYVVVEKEPIVPQQETLVSDQQTSTLAESQQEIKFEYAAQLEFLIEMKLTNNRLQLVEMLNKHRGNVAMVVNDLFDQ